MANSFFRFKQFTVYHDKCAMKVGTDGVLLGIWTNAGYSQTALDIGTGTGLISLILAQNQPGIKIEAIDINRDSIDQAKENIGTSPFQKQINCHQISLQAYTKLSDKKFDLIVSNPPFFINSMKAATDRRTLARHTDSLAVEELISLSYPLLTPEGKISLIYPAEYENRIAECAAAINLYLSRITYVYPKPDVSAKRILIELSVREMITEKRNLIIEKERHVYSEEFRELAKDFYLNM